MNKTDELFILLNSGREMTSKEAALLSNKSISSLKKIMKMYFDNGYVDRRMAGRTAFYKINEKGRGFLIETSSKD